MLRELSAVVDEAKAAVVGLGADPGIDYESTGNGVVGGIVIAELDRGCRRRSSDGVRDVYGKGLVLRTETAEAGLQFRACGEGGELPGEDVGGDGREGDEEDHGRESHQQVGDDETIAHLPQHVGDEPAVKDDAAEDQADGNDDEQHKRVESAGIARQKAQQYENDQGRERPEGAVLRNPGKCRAAQRFQNDGFYAREEVRHTQTVFTNTVYVPADAKSRFLPDGKAASSLSRRLRLCENGLGRV